VHASLFARPSLGQRLQSTKVSDRDDASCHKGGTDKKCRAQHDAVSVRMQAMMHVDAGTEQALLVARDGLRPTNQWLLAHNGHLWRY